MSRAIFFVSDFGARDTYAGVVEAVVAGLAPDARFVHLTHGVPPQDLRHGSYQLFSAAPYLPDRSILLAVVDPGVGSARRAVVIEGERLVYVGPDNGLFEAALSLDPPRRAFLLDDPRYRLAAVSSTFHGRDVFGPAAAHLARGVSASALGPEIAVDSLARLGLGPAAPDATRGVVWTFDHYGNAITTLRAPRVEPRAVRVGERTIPWARCYADVDLGGPLALVGSSGLVELSVRQGSAREALALRDDDPVTLA
jgi:S-adenosylmethionine hydrolase